MTAGLVAPASGCSGSFSWSFTNLANAINRAPASLNAERTALANAVPLSAELN